MMGFNPAITHWGERYRKYYIQGSFAICTTKILCSEVNQDYSRVEGL